MPEIVDYEKVLAEAIEDYNAVNAERDKSADRSSTPEFLERIAWNYFRHQMTDWDDTWGSYEGKPGVHDAYLAAAEALVLAAPSEFDAAAQEWLARKKGAWSRHF